MEPIKNKNISGITYSCYHRESRDGEHFVAQHTLSFQVSGSLVLHDGNKAFPSKAGSLRFIKRNQLLRFIKQPPPDGEFKSINVYLDQETLQDYSKQYLEETHTKKVTTAPVIELPNSALIQNYINSLLAYQESGKLSNQDLVHLKVKEGIMLLLEEQPEIRSILFDFAEPHKIDLEAFMNKNYHFNVKLERFAYLTGRSLATFKRDFAKVFNDSPRHWLQNKRLHQAYYLLQHTGKTPSEVYLDLGFEDLTHFSHAFKRQFGFSPSQIHQQLSN